MHVVLIQKYAAKNVSHEGARRVHVPLVILVLLLLLLLLVTKYCPYYYYYYFY